MYQPNERTTTIDVSLTHQSYVHRSNRMKLRIYWNPHILFEANSFFNFKQQQNVVSQTKWSVFVLQRNKYGKQKMIHTKSTRHEHFMVSTNDNNWKTHCPSRNGIHYPRAPSFVTKRKLNSFSYNIQYSAYSWKHEIREPHMKLSKRITSINWTGCCNLPIGWKWTCKHKSFPIKNQINFTNCLFKFDKKKPQ